MSFSKCGDAQSTRLGVLEHPAPDRVEDPEVGIERLPRALLGRGVTLVDDERERVLHGGRVDEFLPAAPAAVLGVVRILVGLPERGALGGERRASRGAASGGAFCTEGPGVGSSMMACRSEAICSGGMKPRRLTISVPSAASTMVAGQPQSP